MNSERHNLIAFLAILGAIMYLATIAAWLAYEGKYAEALGFGGITTGLVGVIGTFRPKGTSDSIMSKTLDKVPPQSDTVIAEPPATPLEQPA